MYIVLGPESVPLIEGHHRHNTTTTNMIDAAAMPAMTAHPGEGRFPSSRLAESLPTGSTRGYDPVPRNDDKKSHG